MWRLYERTFCDFFEGAIKRLTCFIWTKLACSLGEAPGLLRIVARRCGLAFSRHAQMLLRSAVVVECKPQLACVIGRGTMPAPPLCGAAYALSVLNELFHT
jgi:hypothetical protein